MVQLLSVLLTVLCIQLVGSEEILIKKDLVVDEGGSSTEFSIVTDLEISIATTTLPPEISPFFTTININPPVDTTTIFTETSSSRTTSTITVLSSSTTPSTTNTSSSSTPITTTTITTSRSRSTLGAIHTKTPTTTPTTSTTITTIEPSFKLISRSTTPGTIGKGKKTKLKSRFRMDKKCKRRKEHTHANLPSAVESNDMLVTMKPLNIRVREEEKYFGRDDPWRHQVFRCWIHRACYFGR